MYLPKLQTLSTQTLRPPKLLTGSQWAIEHAWFSAEDNVAKQKYSYAQFPFQKEILDSMTSPDVERVVVMSASQVGKTIMQRIVQGYFIDQDPAPMLMIQPTLTMAEAYSKDRLAPFLRDCPILRGTVADPRARDSGNTLLHKSFPGGHLTLAGANSPASLSSRPVRVVYYDEVDRYPISAGIEGDPVELGAARTRRFWNRKIIMVSTPTITNISRISFEFDKSDKRFFYVPCPECKHFQTLRWPQLVWEPDKPETASYGCENCGASIGERDKTTMIQAGKFKATNPGADTRGYHINELYVIGASWAALVADFLKSKKKRELLQVFINTRLGETFDDHGDAPDYVHIYARREDYARNTIPAEVLFLTAAADVQKDRIECEVRGWGRTSESWSIEHFIFMGDPTDQKVYEQLDALLNQRWLHPHGAQLMLRGLGIDTGGLSTQSVYYWCRRQPPERVFALKGMTMDNPVGIPKAVDVNYGGRKIQKGLKIWGVGVSILKSELYARLRLKPKDGFYPPGYIHYPDYPEEYFAQLTAEAMRVKERNGRKVLTWEKMRDRNEALDMAVYNRATAIILGIDRLTSEDWDTVSAAVAVREDAPKVTQPQKVATVRRRRRVINRGIG